MIIRWNDRSLRWFASASQFTGFHQKLSSILLPSIAECSELCDLGCGAGGIDFALAEHVNSITCIDREPRPLQYINDEARRRGCGNIRTHCCDSALLTGSWDTVLLIFYGKVGDNIVDYLHLCRDNIIAVVRGGSRDDLGKGQYRPPNSRTISCTAAGLNEKTVKWHLTESILEYGQPLESYEDALAYVNAYRKNPDGETPEAYLKRTLVKTNSPLNPYYLPYQKHIGIFTISKAENLHLLSGDLSEQRLCSSDM